MLVGGIGLHLVVLLPSCVTAYVAENPHAVGKSVFGSVPDCTNEACASTAKPQARFLCTSAQVQLSLKHDLQSRSCAPCLLCMLAVH